MIGPADFVLLEMPEACVARGRERYAALPNADPDGWGWAGFAAEFALLESINASDEDIVGQEAPTLDYDLELLGPGEAVLRVEVKTRVVDEGWTHPERFTYITIPTHDGREPVKEAADLIFFCWYSGSDPGHLWALGYFRGLDEFKKRATFFRENEPLPRGGWAPKGGAYSIEIKDLRPLPRGWLKEPDKCSK